MKEKVFLGVIDDDIGYVLTVEQVSQAGMDIW